MRYFLQYDPATALTKVKCPVLVLFGEKDLQVPPKQSRKPVEDALKKGGNTSYKVVVFPNANHLFQNAKTGSPSEYGTLPKEFVPGFLETITGWILERVSVVK
jgi:dipeptidyl aminopeptidase/acylaminoacyl peptidase